MLDNRWLNRLARRSWGGVVLAIVLVWVQGCGGGSDTTEAPEAESVGAVTDTVRAGRESGSDPSSDDAGSRAVEDDVDPAPEAVALPFAPGTEVVGEGFTLRWASWQTEDGSRSSDVTPYVRELIASGGRVPFDRAGFSGFAGDPAPGVNKWLVMVVDTPSRSLRIALHEDSSVYFTIPPGRFAPHGSGASWTDAETRRAAEMLGPEGYAGVGVVWARWGNDGRGGGWADATMPAAEQVAQTPMLINKTHDFGVPARSRHRRKTLRVLLSIDGQPLDLHLRFYSRIILEPTPAELIPPFSELPGPGPVVEEDAGPDYIVAEAPPDVAVSRFVVSSDGSVVYALDAEQRSVMKLDGRTLDVIDAFDNLPEGMVALALSRDERTLYLAGPVNGFDRSRDDAELRGQFVQVETETMSPVGRRVQVRADIRELFVAHDGNLLVLNGSGDSNSFVAVLDPDTGAILGKNNWADPGAAYAMHPDGQRMYNGNSNRVELRWFDPDNEPGVTWNFAAHDSVGDSARGGFVLMGGGSHLLARDGSLLRISNHHPRGLLGIAQVAPNAGGAIAPEAGLMVVSVAGGLQRYRWPAMTPLGETFYDGVIDALVGAPTGTMAYGWRKTEAGIDRFGRTQGDASGTLVAIDLARLVPDGFEPEPAEPEPMDDAGENIAQRLPLRTEVGALLLSPDRATLFALDTAGGRVLRLDAQTLEIQAASAPLPAGSHRLALNVEGELLAVVASPSGFHGNKDREAATVVFLDPQTLEPSGRAADSPLDAYDIAFDHTGGLILSGGSNQHTRVIRIDPDTGRNEEITHAYMRTALRASPDGTLIFTATNGLSPSSMGAFAVGRDGQPAGLGRDNYQRGESPHGGDMWVTGDGRHVASLPGGVFEIDRTREGYRVRGIGALNEPLTGAAGHGAVLLAANRDNTLAAYRLPGLQPIGQALFDGLLEHLCYDPASKRLYAVYYPDRKMGGHPEYQGPARGDIVSIDVGDLWLD
ncbi:MAG: hypothetical protein ACIAXF_11920 [Phycisphaerales bacterium JB063]